MGICREDGEGSIDLRWGKWNTIVGRAEAEDSHSPSFVQKPSDIDSG